MNYFYSLEAYGYEDAYKLVFYSDKKYSQEEFEDLFYDTYRRYSSWLIDKEEDSKCYPNLYFNVDDILSDGDFIDFFCERTGLHRVSDEYSARMVFSLSYPSDDNFSKRFYETFRSIEVDDSCKDDCRIEDEYIRGHAQRGCLVFKKF